MAESLQNLAGRFTGLRIIGACPEGKSGEYWNLFNQPVLSLIRVKKLTLDQAWLAFVNEPNDN
jgi:hypothetical protein